MILSDVETELLVEYFADCWKLKYFYTDITIDAQKMGVNKALEKASKDEYFLLYSKIVGLDPDQYLDGIREDVTECVKLHKQRTES